MKKFIPILMLFLMIGVVSAENIGLNKFSTSSCETYLPSYAGAAAVDGSLATYWQCDTSNAWHMIDLGVGVTGNVSSIYGDTSYGWAFTALTLDASNDNSSWVNIFTNEDCASEAGCNVTGYSVPENYRFWRLSMISPGHTAVAELEYEGTLYVNQAPEITNATIVEDDIKSSEVFLFEITATDPEDDPLTYEWIVGVDVVSTTDIFSFDAALYEAGVHIVDVIVTDGTHNDTMRWEVDVRAKGGEPSLSIITETVTDLSKDESTKSSLTIFFDKIGNFFRGLFK